MWELLTKYAGFITALLYAVMMFVIVAECMVGGGEIVLVMSIVLFLCSFVFWILIKTGQSKGEIYVRPAQGMKVRAVLLIILATIGGICGIVYSAIPYHGELSYVLDRHLNGERVSLKDYNFFEEGITRIVDQIKESQRVEGEAYISSLSNGRVSPDGGLEYIFMSVRIKTDGDKTQEFDVRTDSYKDRIEIKKKSNAGYETEEVSAEKLQKLLSRDEVKEQIMEWEEYYDLRHVCISYVGQEMFTKMDNVEDLSENRDPDIHEDEILEAEGAVLGETVCIEISEGQENSGVCYLMDSRYMNKEEKIKYWEKLQRKDNEMLSCDSDYKTGSIWCNHYSGIGWKAEVTETSEEGNIYQLSRSNKKTGETEVTKDILSGKKGVIQSMTLFNETEGVIGVTDPDWNRYDIFYTDDGGATFTEVTRPVVQESQIDSNIRKRGFTAEDCVYMSMPYSYTDGWRVYMRPCPDEEEGPRFKSSDHGKTWEFLY